jgi:hypothetical protein
MLARAHARAALVADLRDEGDALPIKQRQQCASEERGVASWLHISPKERRCPIKHSA